jgi:tetratricopeptide (TPR) repeat protein
VRACLGLALVLLLPAGVLASPDDLSPLPYYLESVARREAGDTAGAVSALESARSIAPTDPDLALELARAYAADRRYGDAAAAFDEASLLAPWRADLALAQARFHVGHAFRVWVALDAAERAVRLAPEDEEAIGLLDRARTAAALAAGPSVNLAPP